MNPNLTMQSVQDAQIKNCESEGALPQMLDEQNAFVSSETLPTTDEKHLTIQTRGRDSMAMENIEYLQQLKILKDATDRMSPAIFGDNNETGSSDTVESRFTLPQFSEPDSELFVPQEYPAEGCHLEESHEGVTVGHLSANTYQRNNGMRQYVGHQDANADDASEYDPHNGDESDSGHSTGVSLNSFPEGNTDSVKEDVMSNEVPQSPAQKNGGRSRNSGVREPVAKTSKEYVARLHRKKYENIKKQLRKERAKKRHNGDEEVVIELPKAKRNRSSSSKAKKPKDEAQPHGNMDNNGTIQKTSNMFHELDGIIEAVSSGAIPATSQVRVKAASRLKQITASKTQGGDNRHRGTQAKDLKEAMKTFGYSKVISRGDTSYQIKGMRAFLHDWQLTPAAWMSKRENADMPPYGGVLADVPGMGKTVVTLACIVGNVPDKKDIMEWSGATLIILPNQQIAEQWGEEIQKHCEIIKPDDVYLFRRSWNPFSIGRIAEFKIVLTTYSELLAEFPSKEKLNELKLKHEDDSNEYYEAFNKLVGELFRIKWFRVVLDEGHQIKNLEARTTLAAHQLHGKHFWVLSGTPLINRGKELFPYLKLIGVEGITTEEKFEVDFLDKANGMARLDALVNLVSYRRTEDDEFLGRKIMDLPPLLPSDQWVDLSEEERLLYDTVGNHYEFIHPPQIVVAMLRRRQAVSHPYCLERSLREDIQPYSLRHMAQKLRQIEGKRSVYLQMGSRARRQEVPPIPDSDDDNSVTGKKKKKERKHLTPQQLEELKEKKAELRKKREAIQNSIAVAPEDHAFMDPFGESRFGQEFCMAHLLELTEKEKLSREQRCGLCKRKDGIIEPFMLLECRHMFCAVCFMKKVLSLKITVCPTCNTQFEGKGWVEVETLTSKEDDCVRWDSADLKDEDKSTWPVKMSRKEKAEATKKRREARKAVNKKYGGDHNGNLPIIDKGDKAYIKIGVNTPDGVPCPSAKLTACKDIILKWRQEPGGAEDKIIIFVQFVKTAMMAGVMLNLEEIPFVYLTGTMTPLEKQKAVGDFRNNPDIKVLIASMRCGGQALNLTCANRVILIDVWWNNAAERQAFGRVFRLGQLKTSHYVRILARGTIDEDIRNLQEEKADEIAEVLQDDGHVPETLAEHEVMALTAPRAWEELKATLLREIEEEDAAAANAVNAAGAVDAVEAVEAVEAVAAAAKAAATAAASSCETGEPSETCHSVN